MTATGSPGLDPAAVLTEVLAERIADTIPVTHLEFLKLLGLLDIEVSRDIGTAAVSVGARSRLILNPDFIDNHCKSDAALMMLVLHELNHILLGHTRLYPRVTPIHNFVFDALINAQLCQALPDAEHTALFRGLYSAEAFPEALLRPPAGWRTPQEHWSMQGAALKAHQALYGSDTVTHTDLVELLEESARELQGKVVDVGRLLGSHDGQVMDEGADPAVLDAVRDIVARWPALATCAGRDLGVGAESHRIDPAAARRAAVATIRRALATVANVGTGSSGAWTQNRETLRAQLPFRTAVDRRAEVRSAFGLEPLHYRATLPHRTQVRGGRVHVYLDVSGSMDQVIPLLYGALRPLQELLHPQIHLFSTTLQDITPRQLRGGMVLTDGGTDIRCVTEHMVRNRVQRAAIITDGWVGPVPADHERELTRRRVRCAVLLTTTDGQDLARAFRTRSHRIPEIG